MAWPAGTSDLPQCVPRRYDDNGASQPVAIEGPCQAIAAAPGLAAISAQGHAGDLPMVSLVSGEPCANRDPSAPMEVMPQSSQTRNPWNIEESPAFGVQAALQTTILSNTPQAAWWARNRSAMVPPPSARREDSAQTSSELDPFGEGAEAASERRLLQNPAGHLDEIRPTAMAGVEEEETTRPLTADEWMGPHGVKQEEGAALDRRVQDRLMTLYDQDRRFAEEAVHQTLSKVMDMARQHADGDPDHIG